MLKKYFVASCLSFLLFFLIIERHFVSSQNLKEKPTNNIPAGQSDLKTAKSVFLSPRPSKLSKLQCCWTTAEKWMAPPHTAAYEAKLIAEIFRKPVQFKGGGGLRPGPFTHAAQSSHAEIACSASFLSHFGHLPHQSHVILPLRFCSGRLCLQFPSFYLFFLSFQGWYKTAVAVSSEQLVWCIGNITERVDKHRLRAARLPGFAGSCRALAGLKMGDQRGLGTQLLWVNRC